MCMKFRWHHRNPFGVGLQGLVQGLVRLCSLPGPTGPTLIQGPTQTVNIVIFAIFGLGCGEIAQEAFFVLTASTPKIRLGAAHTTAHIRRIASDALSRQFNDLFVCTEAEFKVDELVAYSTIIGIEHQGTQEGLPGTRWLQFALDGGKGHEIVLTCFPTHLKDAQEVSLRFRVMSKRLLALRQKHKLCDIIGHETSP